MSTRQIKGNQNNLVNSSREILEEKRVVSYLIQNI